MPRRKISEAQSVQNSVLRKEWLTALEDAGVPHQPAWDTRMSVIPTGFESFDQGILRSGGFPRGRIIQLYGEPGSGKSLIALRLMAMAQMMYPDRMVGYIDSEYTFDKVWAERQGVDTSIMQFAQTHIMEEAFGYLLKWASTGVFSMIVLDSLGQLQPVAKSSINKFDLTEKGERVNSMHVGLDARVISEGMKDIAGLVARNETLLVGVNQVREKIGVLYGDPTTTPGGKLWKHDLSIDVHVLTPKPVLDKNKEKIGLTVPVNVKRNKYNGFTGKTDDSNHMVFYDDDGIEKARAVSILDRAARAGVLVVAKTWIKLIDPDTDETLRTWQGRGNAQQAVMDNEEVVNEIQAMIDKADDRQRDHSKVSTKTS